MAVRLFWQKVKNRRIDMDITQKFLSEKFDINLNTIKGWETGRTGIDSSNTELLTKFKNMVEYLGFSLEEVYQKEFKQTKVLAIVNNKGGCGKTSITGNLGFALSELNNRILFIDADMQSNLTQSFNLDSDDELNLGNALKYEKDLTDYIVHTNYENLDFIKASLTMSKLEMDLFPKARRETIFQRCLNPIIEKGIYDYVLIDTNPTLANLNLNILNASDFVIIPVQMNSFGLTGLKTVFEFIQGAKEMNEKLTLMGIVINNYDVRKSVTTDSEKFLRQAYPNYIMKTIIKVDTTIENAQYQREPVITFNRNSRIAKEFKELAKEVINYGK